MGMSEYTGAAVLFGVVLFIACAVIRKSRGLNKKTERDDWCWLPMLLGFLFLLSMLGSLAGCIWVAGTMGSLVGETGNGGWYFFTVLAGILVIPISMFLTLVFWPWVIGLALRKSWREVSGQVPTMFGEG